MEVEVKVEVGVEVDGVWKSYKERGGWGGVEGVTG